MKFYLACIALVAVFYSAKGDGPKTSPSPLPLHNGSETVKPVTPTSSGKNDTNGTKADNTTSIIIVNPSIATKVSTLLAKSTVISPSRSSTSAVDPNTTHTTVHQNATSYVPSNATVVPSNATVVPSNATVVPSNATVVPSNATVVPSNSTVVPSSATMVPSHVTVVSPHPSHSVTPKPPPTKSAGKDDKDYDNMKKRMWIAGSFAIIFALTTVILGYLVYRQRKINRELEGDPATSRLL